MVALAFRTSSGGKQAVRHSKELCQDIDSVHEDFVQQGSLQTYLSAVKLQSIRIKEFNFIFEENFKKNELQPDKCLKIYSMPPECALK